MSRNSEEDKIRTKYVAAVKGFESASGKALDLVTSHIDTSKMGILAGGLTSEITTNILANIVSSELAQSVPLSAIYESSAYLKDKSVQYLTAISVIDPGLRNKIKANNKTLGEVTDESIESMPPNEASNHIADYYRSIIDMDFSSQKLKSLAEEFSEKLTDDQLEQNSTPIRNTVTILLSSIRRKVNEIGERIKTFAKEVGSYLTTSLSKFQDLVDNMKEDIKTFKNKAVEAFKDLADKFMDFIGKLIEKMFNFLTQFGLLAKNAGYNLTKIEIKLPRIQLTSFNILSLVQIPIPVIEPPDITLTISSGKAE